MWVILVPLRPIQPVRKYVAIADGISVAAIIQGKPGLTGATRRRPEKEGWRTSRAMVTIIRKVRQILGMNAVMSAMPQNVPVVGNGIYSYLECARFLGIAPRRLRAWYRGWPDRPAAFLQSDYAGMFDGEAISFLDFVDAAVSVTLRVKYRVKPSLIRRARKNLAKEWETKHPFARKDFYAGLDGQRFYWFEEREDEHGPWLVDAVNRQHAMPEIMLPFLSRVEYNQVTGMAQVFPLLGRVVLDPRRKYGKPTVQGTGMTTGILHDCYRATGSVEEVADWYNVTTEDVEEAICFEEDFSGIAA